MKLLSTGEEPTLKTYKKLAGIIGGKAVAFIQNKINNSPNGENELVIADEFQMIILLCGIENKEVKK